MNKKNNKKIAAPKSLEELGDKNQKVKPKNDKVKYRHMSHWLEDDEDIEIDLFGRNEYDEDYDHKYLKKDEEE